MSSAPSRSDAEALDAADELAPFRSRFAIDPDGPIYLDGNSLGRLPLATIQRLDRVVREEWGSGLVGSWLSSWIDLPRSVGDRLAGGLLGAQAGGVLLGGLGTRDAFKR